MYSICSGILEHNRESKNFFPSPLSWCFSYLFVLDQSQRSCPLLFKRRLENHVSQVLLSGLRDRLEWELWGEGGVYLLINHNKHCSYCVILAVCSRCMAAPSVTGLESSFVRMDQKHSVSQ